MNKYNGRKITVTLR